ncbi:helix-turn-helix domain-containing protein [Nocardia otitidiscaviarum]|uniref:helix-turn-helix domain-containing protein n=1 Tax=Nocardia otitidiscaviarum TaxID=1823 RepID=UPI0004A6F7A0|nr:helix-turn-helix transcriptional regulator [Nocardia otitidiscaviarum]
MDGDQIRSARKARGWSQTALMGALRTLAVRKNVTLMGPDSLRVALSRWENNHTTPDSPYRELLCEVLELTTEDSQPVVEFDQPTDGSLFALLAHHTDSLRLLDRKLGAPAVRAQTSSHVAALEDLWRRSVGADRADVARAQADTAALAGWQDFDCGDTHNAAKHYALARTSASRCGDATLLAHAMGEQAAILAEIGRADTAFTEVIRAEKLPALPPLLRSWLAATRAQVATYLPDGAAIAHSALHAAETALAHVQCGDDASLPYLALDPVHLERWKGHILVRLQDPAAARITEQAMQALPGDFVRAGSAQLLDLAEAAATRRELDEATALLEQADARISVVKSARLKRRHTLLSRRVELATARQL